MTLHWTKEDNPRWDADKQRLFGPDDLAAVDLDPPAAGTPVSFHCRTSRSRSPAVSTGRSPTRLPASAAAPSSSVSRCLDIRRMRAASNNAVL